VTAVVSGEAGMLAAGAGTVLATGAGAIAGGEAIAAVAARPKNAAAAGVGFGPL
jgi:hypothetical protein